MKIAPIAAVIGGLVLLAPAAACTEGETHEVVTPPPGVTSIVPSVEAGPKDPTLTAEQEAKVRGIIAEDQTLSHILSGRMYSTEDIGPWTTGVMPETGEYSLIGATARITLPEPILLVEGEWPYASYRTYYHLWTPDVRAQYLPYREGTSGFTVHNLREMYVLVDLDSGKLVEITVLDLPDGQKVTHPTAPTPEPVPGGEEMAREIFASDERMQAILAGRDYRILAIWAASFEETRLASVIVQWDDREDIEADWPILIDFDEESGAYEVTLLHFKAETVGQLDALIDLDKQQVITIEPSVGD